MNIYTKTGDKGLTNLINEKGVPKYDNRIEAIGTIDELTSSLGTIKPETDNANIINDITHIQTILQKVMASIAGMEYKDNSFELEISEIEKRIDYYVSNTPMPKTFVLPGSTKVSALIDFSRSVARRCERIIAFASNNYDISNGILIYMNRLSDLLYIMARNYELVNIVQKAILNVLNFDSVTNSLKLSSAKKLIDKIEKKALEMEIKLAIAVVNEAGNPIAAHCMDDCYIASYELSINKAYTAVALKMPTGQLAKLTQPGQEFYGVQHSNGGRIVIVGGGIPLVSNGKIIGGLGVSGGSEKQDSYISEYAQQHLKEVLC